MNKFFLVVRIIVLIMLLFLLAAVFWGVANRDKTQASDGTADLYERYQRSKPAGYTSILLIALVVLGIFIVVASIIFEYHMMRKGIPRETSEPSKRKKDRTDWQ